MAKAKNKNSDITAVEPSDFQTRLKGFEAELIPFIQELIKKYQVGLAPQLASNTSRIEAVLGYVDLVKDEQNPTKAD